MSFKLVFENSGDEVLFKLTHNPEVAKWFLEKLTRKEFTTDDLQDLDLKRIHKYWRKFMEIGDKLDTYFEFIKWYDDIEDLLDPKTIADLHYAYACTTEWNPGWWMARVTSANATQKMNSQEEADYKYRVPHKRVHDLFIKKIELYRERFEMGHTIEKELQEILAKWLINHIQHDDADYVGAVKENMMGIIREKEKKKGKNWFARFFA